MDKPKILIVDDDPDLRRGLNLRLRASHFETAYAADGFSAIAMAQKERPDLIILDIGLPAGDGFVVLDRLQQSATLASIPVIVLTARDPQYNRERTLKAGACAFLQKPADNNTGAGRSTRRGRDLQPGHPGRRAPGPRRVCPGGRARLGGLRGGQEDADAAGTRSRGCAARECAAACRRPRALAAGRSRRFPHRPHRRGAAVRQRRPPRTEPRLHLPPGHRRSRRKGGNPGGPHRDRQAHRRQVAREKHVVRGAHAGADRGCRRAPAVTGEPEARERFPGPARRGRARCLPGSGQPHPETSCCPSSTRKPTGWPLPRRSARWAPSRATATAPRNAPSRGHSPGRPRSPPTTGWQQQSLTRWGASPSTRERSWRPRPSLPSWRSRAAPMISPSDGTPHSSCKVPRKRL